MREARIQTAAASRRALAGQRGAHDTFEIEILVLDPIGMIEVQGTRTSFCRKVRAHPDALPYISGCPEAHGATECRRRVINPNPPMCIGVDDFPYRQSWHPARLIVPCLSFLNRVIKVWARVTALSLQCNVANGQWLTLSANQGIPEKWGGTTPANHS